MPIRVAIALLVTVSWVTPSFSAYTIYNAFPNLSPFSQSLDLQDPLDGTDRLFVVEKAGRIHVFENDPLVAARQVFLDIADSVTDQGESGLVGLAFHPDYETNGFFFVVYITKPPLRTVLARFSVSLLDPNAADRLSEFRLLEIPFVNIYHKAGCIQFGPDGYLYMSLGDDGEAHKSQDRTLFNGKVLRIDVDSITPGYLYGIPADNPFAGNTQGYLEEIWAFGFRNPWRFSLDTPTGRLWLGDVGQFTWEEIDLVKNGRNYGWPRMEGPECPPPSCDTTGLNLVMPLYSYPHNGGAAVTGGRVYRGPSLASLAGKYIYADYVTDQVWALEYDGVNPPINTEIYSQPFLEVVSFGVDKDNEIHLVSLTGDIYRLQETATDVRSPELSGDRLVAAHPNPFHPRTTFRYTIAAPTRARIDVYDLRGRRVRVLADRLHAARDHSIPWDGRDDQGQPLPSGVYHCRLVVGGVIKDALKVVLLK